MRRRGTNLTHEDLEKGLRSSSTTAERIRALLALGIPPDVLARGLGVRSASTLRNWMNDEIAPRPTTAITLDDLRLTAQVLLEGGLPPARIGNWLVSRNAEWLGGERPIDCITTTPMRVLSAAQDTAIELMDSSAEKSRGASDTADHGPSE